MIVNTATVIRDGLEQESYSTSSWVVETSWLSAEIWFLQMLSVWNPATFFLFNSHLTSEKVMQSKKTYLNKYQSNGDSLLEAESLIHGDKRYLRSATKAVRRGWHHDGNFSTPMMNQLLFERKIKQHFWLLDPLDACHGSDGVFANGLTDGDWLEAEYLFWAVGWLITPECFQWLSLRPAWPNSSIIIIWKVVIKNLSPFRLRAIDIHVQIKLNSNVMRLSVSPFWISMVISWYGVLRRAYLNSHFQAGLKTWWTVPLSVELKKKFKEHVILQDLIKSSKRLMNCSWPFERRRWVSSP